MTTELKQFVCASALTIALSALAIHIYRRSTTPPC